MTYEAGDLAGRFLDPDSNPSWAVAAATMPLRQAISTELGSFLGRWKKGDQQPTAPKPFMQALVFSTAEPDSSRLSGYLEKVCVDHSGRQISGQPDCKLPPLGLQVGGLWLRFPVSMGTWLHSHAAISVGMPALRCGPFSRQGLSLWLYHSPMEHKRIFCSGSICNVSK